MVQYCETSLGATLRECRMISGLTLNEASTAADLQLTHLLDIENEGCGPTEDILRSLMAVYSPAIRSLHVIPGSNEPDTPDDRRIRAKHAKSEIDWLRLLLRSEEMTNNELLEEVAVAVRALRQLGPTVPVQMRTPEADLLVSMLDLTDKELPVTIMTVFGLSVAQTRDFLSGALNRAERRAGGTNSEFLRRLSGLSFADLEDEWLAA